LSLWDNFTGAFEITVYRFRQGLHEIQAYENQIAFRNLPDLWSQERDVIIPT